MALKHRLLAASYYPLKLSNAFLRHACGDEGGRLRVLLYHDVSPVDEEHFIAQLRWLSRGWRFITPDDFSAMMLGQLPVIGDCLLLTFDDGFASNRRIAEKVLDAMKIKALFFIVSEFAALSESADCRDFISQKIWPGLEIANIPSHWKNMGWSDIEYLLESGHSIGAHTANHARLSHVAAVNLPEEIISSADILEKKLGCRIEHFAYTFGDLHSFSPAAQAIARSRFKFIHTGMRGLNTNTVPPWAIRRDALAASDPLALVGSLLEGGADRFYARNLAVYESWCK